MKKSQPSRHEIVSQDLENKPTGLTSPGRRDFLKTAGMSAAGLALFAASCKKTNNNSNGISFGTGDYAILNFAYALEQIEAAFYTKVSASYYAGITTDEQTLLSDIVKHEIVHREFFKIVLGSNAIPSLAANQFNFSTIDFTSRSSVLMAAQAFEDLGVQAYNGAGSYIVNPAYLVVAGQIVSVEARHAAYLRDLNKPYSFADSTLLDANALEQSKKPRVVMAIAGAFVTVKFDISTLPNS
jgi:hypothetical protein